MANNTSPHILSTATNLLGFCFFAITSLHLFRQTEKTLVDEFTSVIALLLVTSSILSFMSIKTQDEQKGERLEKLADFFFIIALLGILGIILFITITFWNK